MATTPRDELHTMVDALPDEDLSRAKEYLSRLRARDSRDSHDALDALRRELGETGFLARVGRPPSTEAIQRHAHRDLVDVPGNAVSDTIIEGRGELD